MKYDKNSIYHDTICQWLYDKGSRCKKVGDELSGSIMWVYGTVLGEWLYSLKLQDETEVVVLYLDNADKEVL